MADLPFHSSSASPEELSKVIYDSGKESIEDKLGTFDNAEALTNKVIKEAVKHLEHAKDKFAGEAQRVASLKNQEDAPADVKKVYELVRQHVLGEFGEGPDHKTVVEAIVQSAHDAMNRKPLEKVQKKFAHASLSPEEAADRLLKEAQREIVRKEVADKELQPGVKGSGMDGDSLASTVQSVVDRAGRENPPPAVAEAKAVLASQIEAARIKAPVAAPEAAKEAAAEE
ncbi:hypothetical protein WJX81_004814 [Elliptochloris bilobata]|uniref:Uncharacterized protein n=1 Tax=Elliptochloris bilobata TaxID=381761 RepID=A0AAW1QUE0_9CHLO